jgi:hypothetical protein
LSMRTEVIRPFSYKKPGCAFALHRNGCSFFRREQYNNHVLISYQCQCQDRGNQLADIVKAADVGRWLM